MMQAASDIFLGFTQDQDSGRQFYVRTLKNRRLGSVSEITEGAAFPDYARLCGRTLARAHARSGDPAAITGYSGKSEVLDDAIASFAMAYADPRSRRSCEGEGPGKVGQGGKSRLERCQTGGRRMPAFCVISFV